MTDPDLFGRLVSHREELRIPLRRKPSLEQDGNPVVGGVWPGEPLLVLETSLVVMHADSRGRPTSWAHVTDGTQTGWLPVPLHRLTVVDEVGGEE